MNYSKVIVDYLRLEQCDAPVEIHYPWLGVPYAQVKEGCKTLLWAGASLWVATGLFVLWAAYKVYKWWSSTTPSGDRTLAKVQARRWADQPLHNPETAGEMYALAQKAQEAYRQFKEGGTYAPKILLEVLCPRCASVASLMMSPPVGEWYLDKVQKRADLYVKTHGELPSGHGMTGACPMFLENQSPDAFAVPVAHRVAMDCIMADIHNTKGSEVVVESHEITASGALTTHESKGVKTQTGKKKTKTQINTGSEDVRLAVIGGDLAEAEAAEEELARLDREWNEMQDGDMDFFHVDDQQNAMRWGEQMDQDAALDNRLRAHALEQQLGRGRRHESRSVEQRLLAKQDQYLTQFDQQWRKFAKDKEQWMLKYRENFIKDSMTKADMRLRDVIECESYTGLFGIRRMFHQEEDDIGRSKLPRHEAGNTIVVTDDACHKAIPRTQLSQFVDAQYAESDALIARHNEVVSSMENKEVQTETKPKPGANKARVTVESEMANSRPSSIGKNTACIRVGDDVRGAAMFVDQQGLALFATHRHARYDGDIVDVPWPVGTEFQATFMCRAPTAGPIETLKWVTGKVVSAVANKDEDVVWLYTDIPTNEMPDGKPGPAVLATAAMQFFLDLHKDRYEWMLSPGVFVHNKEKLVHYTNTTEQGQCGYPVYTSSGTIAAIHTYGNVVYGGNKVSNAGFKLVRPAPPKRGSTQLPAYNPLSLTHQAREVLKQRLQYFKEQRTGGRSGYSDPLRLWGLRTDVNLRGLKPVHYWMKPSTSMNKMELDRFADKVVHDMKPELLKKAVMAAIMYDIAPGIKTPYQEPTSVSVKAVIDTMDLEKSAGDTGAGMTAYEYIKSLGEGDLEAGKIQITANVMALYKDIMLGTDTDRTAAMFRWTVFGKKDGYKEKKLPPTGSGRTIQAPPLEMKIMWRVCFGENDDVWLNRGAANAPGEQWVHQGEDADLPCSYAMLQVLRQALGAFAADLSAFDRYIQPILMALFFKFYMPAVCVGAPQQLMDYLYQITCNSILVLTSGECARKFSGHPSGFMNTLRLNCIVHLICMFYVYFARHPEATEMEAVQFFQEDIVLQICGDDSRVFALTPAGVDFLDLENEGKAYMEVWATDLPWEVKAEGVALFTPQDTMEERCAKCPGMVSRHFVWIDGVLWEPLFNISRAIKRLVCNECRDSDVEDSLQASAFMTCALQCYWQFGRYERKYYSSALECVEREFFYPRAAVNNRVAYLMGRVVDRQFAPSHSTRRVARVWGC